MTYKDQRDKLVGKSWWCRRNRGAANQAYRLIWDHFRWVAAGSRLDDPEMAIRQEAERMVLSEDARNLMVEDIQALFKSTYGGEYRSAVLLLILKLVIPVLIDLFIRWLLDESQATSVVMECHSCS